MVFMLSKVFGVVTVDVGNDMMMVLTDRDGKRGRG